MKFFIQLISVYLFSKVIKAKSYKIHEEDITKPASSEKAGLTINPSSKDGELASSSSEDDGILIQISEKKNKGSSKLKKDKLGERKGESKSKHSSLPKSSAVTKLDKPKMSLNPFNFDVKKSIPAKSTPPTNLKTPTKLETFSPLDSTYKTPTSDFLLKDFESKSVKVSFTEKEMKELENFSKNLDIFMPSINRVNVIVKNITKANKKDEDEKNKKNKPSELFNIKVIEVSDGTNPN